MIIYGMLSLAVWGLYSSNVGLHIAYWFEIKYPLHFKI